MNHISKIDLHTEIYIAVFQGEYKRVEKLSKLLSNTLNSNKNNCYSYQDFSHLINYELLKHALVDTGVSKSIIIAKNVPTKLLYHKQLSDVL